MLIFLLLVLIILCLALQLFPVHLSSSLRLLLWLLSFLGGELVIYSVSLRYITCAEYTHFYGGRKPGKKDAGAAEECMQ